MPFLLHLFLLLIPNPALLSHGASVASESQPVKLVVSERCISDPNAIEGQEFDLTPGSPLVLTHRIRLVPSSGSGSCCQSEFAAVNERIEALEREVSELREKCGGLNGGCCTSQQSQGVGCSTVRPPTDKCLNDCNDQGRCIDGKCVCFAGFSGPDCSVPDCPGDCSNKGKCVNGKCVCDPGFAGPDCSVKTCPNNCSNNGRCVNGKCVCNAGFTGSDCSTVQCPGNCNNKGRCVNGKCVCVAGFTGLDCSEKSCPGNCNNKGRCVDGKCVCNPEFTSPDCSERSCPKNCNNKGRCVNGKCVCDAGFTGLDCSEKSCPRKCNNKGRCVDGKCVCNSGFTGLDCSEKTCPGNCNNKGRCVNGKCVCDEGFTGLDCSEKTCPRNCKNKGRCVDGKCVCNPGFTGLDCSEKTCPGNCNNKGRCVNGKCVCDEGFTGLDCSEKTCPGNCNNKGRCVNGKCVCDEGFTGLDCSEKTCPGNCKNKGRCVNGKCVCDEGFTGLDCSEKTCPGNCKNKGRCVNGNCVCDAGFTGPDCSEKTCPNNCSNKGRCVNGKCVCDDGFTGPDCSEKTCPNNCSNKGRCVNGQCVCEVGFTGPDCSTKTCLNNCSNRGRCVNGKCVCNPGFAEPDCSECTDGFAGPDCATALIAVSHLSARNITESSVTLFWTPPAVQYNTYHITFTSEKENDQITERVNGGISSYTQVGLAPGQRYIVTIVGEKDGKMGAKSTTTFQTLISGPKNLHVVKTSTTSVIVQWEAAQGQIDRYILFTAPNQTDGSGEGRQEKTLPSGIDSAQIDGLQPGRLYDVSLVAVKDGTRSLPATVQATPGINAGLPDPASRNTRGSDGILSNLRLQNTTKGSSSQYQSGINPSREKDPETLRNSVEPTVTTERNITAYGINGTKYVRRVLIRHRLLHLNRESNGKALTGNVSLVLGQVSRNDILTNIPDRTAGSSEEVKPLLGKGPKLQEGRFQKHPIQEELQKETLTTPSPSHSFTVTQRSVVPSETQDQPTNKLQTPSRDRHHALTSLQLPPSSNYRYSGGPILSGSSTSLINGRHLPPPVSSRVSSQKPVQKILFGNVSSSQSSQPPEVDKETLTKTTNSKESVQGLSKGSLVSSLPEGTTDTENINEDHFPKHKETINRTVPLYNRMPYRGPFPRRPNIGPFQNRTSTFQQPYRNPIRRPLLSRINNTAINRVEPGTFSSNQHVLTPNRPPIFTRQRKNGTVIRLPPKLLGQIKTAGAAVENKSKETNILFPADTDSHPKSELSLSTDKASSKSNAKIQPVSGRSEMTIEHILPRVTNSDNDTTLPNHQRASGVIIGRQNASNLKIRPTFLLKRINNTIIRLPSRIPALTNVNSTTIYSPFKNNNYETRLKDSKDTSRDTGTKLFKLPTEGALTGITDTLKGISEGLENATEHINKKQLPRVTSRDPEIPKIATRDHDLPSLANITTTLPLLINHNTESEIKEQRENVPDQNQNKFILKRKDGTLVRLRPKRPNQIKPNTPTFHSGLKESVILPTDKPTAENNYKLQAVAAGLEVSNDNVLPRITTKAQDLSRITSPEQNLTIITSRNQDLLRNTEGGNYLPKVTDKDQDLSITTRKQVASKIIKENVPTTPRKNGTFQPKPHADIEQKSTTIQSGLKDKGPNVGKVAEESTEFTDQSVSAGEEANNDNIPLNITNRGNSSPMQVKPEFHSISQKGPTSNFTATFTMRKKNGTDLRPALKRPSKPKIMPEHGNLKQNKESSITIPQNTFNRNRRPPFTLQRKNGTHTRLPPKVLSQLRPDSGRKNSTQDLKLDWSTEVSHPTDTTKSRSPISEVPEDGISEIGVQNLTSNSFIIIWVAPEGRFKNFVIRITEENDEDVNEGDGSKQEEEVQARTDGSDITTNVIADVRRNSSNVVVRQNSIRLLPGSARSYPVSGLSAQTGYSVTLYGTRPGSHSKIHTSVITTGPEPPSHLSFSDITDTSLSVSWRRPKSSVSGFKVTYIHTKEGEPISVTVDSGISTLTLTKLSPGSTYEVTIISVLGLDESDPIKDFIITLPDPPTDLRAINITDTKALLLWRPALATADQYIITYHAEEDTGSNISVKVSGNAVEQQLQALKASTKYRVTIFSQLGDQKSSSTHTSFTTASGSPGKGEAPRDLVAKRVTARTAVLSWKPPSSAVTSYKLTYFIKGGERKEVTLNPGVSEHKLKGLHPSSKYTALLQGERGRVFTSTISTEFTTVTLRFPYPSDCSQELLNGELDSGLVEIFPGGKDGGSVKVYCDMETDKGGWTVFQRRKDGKTKFFRTWHEYRKGFGDLEGEFWLGNDALHNLTAMTPMNMRVDLRTQNESVYAHYASFSVDTARKHYIVQVSGYSGTAGDSMQYHDKRPFSTFDRDPQPLITRCAMSYKGGWWYRNCHEANLNGLYDTHTNHQGVIWTAWKGTKFSIPFTEMKIRPASFTP